MRDDIDTPPVQEGRHAALRITVIYLVIAALWILFSDWIVKSFVTDPALLSSLQTTKGWLFVAVTAALLYVLIRRSLARRQQADASIRRLAGIVESTDDAVIAKKLDGTIESWNQGAERIYGYTLAEAMGQPISMLVPDDRSDELSRILDRLRRGERIDHFATVRIAKGGRQIHVSLTISPIRDGDGSTVGFSTVARDITERKRAEVALRDREHRYRSVIETAASAIMCVTSRHEISEWNPEAERIFGYSREEALGKNPYELLLEDHLRDGVMAEAEKVMAGEPTRAFELPCLVHDGSQRILLWNATRLLDGHHQPIGYFAVGQDITELKAAQDKLIQSERLAAMGQMLSAIAHESRNALQRIQAGVDMLMFEIDEQSEAGEDLARIVRGAEDLQRLFDELRTYAAPIKLDASTCSLSKVWQQAWSHLEVARTGRNVELHEETNGVDLTISIDAFRVEQVFRNLMENSLAACNDPIRLQISCHESNLDGSPAVCVSWRDNGPGLTDEQKKRIFEAFFTTKSKGTGLGMAIANRIIEAHQGTIRVGDCHHGGAEFLVTLPRSL